MSETNEMKPRYECVNAMYFKANDYTTDDVLVINEKCHKPNGEITKQLRFIYNYKKPVYIHKEGYRKYKTKQVWKPKDEMDVYWSTESELGDTIKRALGIPLSHYMPMKQICRSPYVYGTDTPTTCIIKKEYRDRFPNTVSPMDVAVLDIETNVISARGETVAISLSFKDKAVIATTREYLGTTPLPTERFYELLDKLTPEVRQDRQCNVEFVIADSAARAIIEVFKRAHEWKPDVITGWNVLGFDIPRIEADLRYEGYDPAEVFSDPSVPDKFKTFQYRKGPTSKKMASGKEQPLAGYEQWHWVNAPAAFFFIDAMCLYYQIRRGGPKEENYKLETILQKEIGRGKLGIKEAEHLDGIDLHRFMQTRYKIEYLVYNLFDCVGLEMLDEKTKDIRSTFGVLAGVSDWGNYTSNPKLLSDALSFFVQEDSRFNGVLGTVSDELKTSLDSLVPGLDGWVVALATERLQDNMGLFLLSEMPNHRTKAHAHSSDIDVSSGYPNIERAMNMSKDTTIHELTRIEGLTYEEQRIIGLNMLGGKANSMSFANKVYRLPRPEKLYEMFTQQVL